MVPLITDLTYLFFLFYCAGIISECVLTLVLVLKTLHSIVYGKMLMIASGMHRLLYTVVVVNGLGSTDEEEELNGGTLKKVCLGWKAV